MKHFSLKIFSLILLCCALPLHAENHKVIAVIGTGDLGDSVGPSLAAAGYKVIYGSRDPTKASVAQLVTRTGAGSAAMTQKDAAQAAEIVLLAVPWPAMEQVAQNLGDLSGKIVIDASFPFQQASDGYMESSVATSSAEMIQVWNPSARVVKVSLPGAYLIDDPMQLGQRSSIDIAADDREAKETTARLIVDMGLEPFDAGPLRYSRYIEAVGMLYMVPLLQGRAEGIEIFYRRSSYGPCVWKVTDYYEPVADANNLAQFPKPIKAPEPCSAHSNEP